MLRSPFSPGLPENRSRQGWRPRRGDFFYGLSLLWVSHLHLLLTPASQLRLARQIEDSHHSPSHGECVLWMAQNLRPSDQNGRANDVPQFQIFSEISAPFVRPAEFYQPAWSGLLALRFDTK